MATMEALVFQGPGRYGVQSMPRPEVRRDDDVMVRPQAVGICGTDLHVVEVPPGFPATPGTILGHEFSAEVVAAGDQVGGLKVGDRVAIEPNIACMSCAYCKRGMPNQCLSLGLTGIERHGGLAEYCVMPARNVHKIPDGLSYEVAALTEPLSCVLGGTEKVGLQPGETVVVLGAGPIGLLYLQVFRAAGARKAVVVEPHPARAEYARELGAHVVVDPKREDVVARVMEETEIGGDVVVDAVGNQIASALKLGRRGAAIVLFGINLNAQETVRQFDITRQEYRVLGSFIGSYNFPQSLHVLASGAIDAERMITHRIGLYDVDAGMAELKSGRAIKVLVRPTT